MVCLFIVYNAIVVLRFALRTIYVISKRFYVRYLKHRLGFGNLNKNKKDKDMDDSKNLLDSNERRNSTTSPNRVNGDDDLENNKKHL